VLAGRRRLTAAQAAATADGRLLVWSVRADDAHGRLAVPVVPHYTARLPRPALAMALAADGSTAAVLCDGALLVVGFEAVSGRAGQT
jgi:hypothetical protein